MSIRESLQKAAVLAAKGGDRLKLEAVRFANSAIRYREIEKRKPLEEEEVMQVLSSLCKQRRESIEQFKKGERQDLVEKEERELQFLLSFLPQQLPREKIVEVAKEVIASLGAQSQKDMGRVMKELMPRLAGRADGSVVGSVVKELLT